MSADVRFDLWPAEKLDSVCFDCAKGQTLTQLRGGLDKTFYVGRGTSQCDLSAILNVDYTGSGAD